MGLRRKATWQLLSGLVVMALGILQISILTRFFQPSEFGVLAIVTVVVAVVQAMSGAGIANYLVYKQSVDKVLNATVFWLMFGMGLLLCVCVWLLSFILEAIYQYAGLQQLIAYAGLSFIFIGLSGQLQSRFLLAGQLDVLAKVDILSKFLGVIISLLLVFVANFGVIAVVWGSVATSLFRFIQIYFAAPKDWLPSFQFSKSLVGDAWRYGAFNVASQLVNQIRTNLDALVLGLVVGAADLGFYSLAKQLAAKPTILLTPIAQRFTLPVFSMLQASQSELTKSVLNAHSLVCFVSVFVALSLLVVSPSLLELMYGHSYLEGVLNLFNLLIVFYAVRLVSGVVAGSIVEALGFTKKGFYWNVGSFFAQILALSLGVLHGVEGVCWALIFMQVLLIPASYAYFFRAPAGVSVWQYVIPVFLAVFIGIFALLISLYSSQLFGGGGLLVALVSLFVFSLFYGLSLVIVLRVFRWVSFDFNCGRI